RQRKPLANIPIVHSTTKVDYTGSGAISANQELIAADWNATHVTLSAGAGLNIVTDGGTPPIITFSVSSTEPTATTFGGSLIPTQDNVFDVGSPPLRWRSFYFGTALSGGSSVIGSETVSTTISAGAVYLTGPLGATNSIKFLSNGTGLSGQTGAFGSGIQLDGSADL